MPGEQQMVEKNPHGTLQGVRPVGRPRKYETLEEFRAKERERVNRYHERKRRERELTMQTASHLP